MPGTVADSVMWRKLQTPGTAEEHKRQETPTIIPNDRQPTHLTDKAPGTTERAARERDTQHQSAQLPCTPSAQPPPAISTHTQLGYPQIQRSPLRSTGGLSRITTQTSPASAGTHSAPPAWGALIRGGRRTAQGARPASEEGKGLGGMIDEGAGRRRWIGADEPTGGGAREKGVGRGAGRGGGGVWWGMTTGGGQVSGDGGEGGLQHYGRRGRNGRTVQCIDCCCLSRVL